jgi:hypothetical protein
VLDVVDISRIRRLKTLSEGEPPDLGMSSAAGRDEPRGQWSLELGSLAAIEHWPGSRTSRPGGASADKPLPPRRAASARKPSMVTGVARSRQPLLHARIVSHHLDSWIACRLGPGDEGPPGRRPMAVAAACAGEHHRKRRSRPVRGGAG